jgi:hypothetical protein
LTLNACINILKLRWTKNKIKIKYRGAYLIKGNTMEIGSDSTYQHAQRLTLRTPTLISTKNLLRERERERPKSCDKSQDPFMKDKNKYLYD